MSDNIKRNSIDLSTMGKRIAYTRKLKKLTQAVLAQRVNTVQTVIRDYEIKKTKQFIDPALLIRIAKELNVTTDWLLTGEWNLSSKNRKRTIDNSLKPRTRTPPRTTNVFTAFILPEPQEIKKLAS